VPTGSKITAAPTPDHYADFANLWKQLALRYPDVHYFQVWTKLKGFCTLNRWDYESYTQCYNLIHDAPKPTNPNNQVGGPYVVMTSWTEPGTGGWSARNPSLYN
jgi:hypothetical protein